MRLAFLFTVLTALAAAFEPATSDQPNPSQIEEIIKNFAAKEAEFSKARENYTYHQTVRVQEYDDAGAPGGKWDVDSDIVFDLGGKRTERVVKAPVPTLRMVNLSPEDEQDLRAVQPFVLTSQDVDKYHVRYVGKDNVDEIPCYLFAVRPKKMEQGKRYFAGLIWVDDRDLQIVKSYGRATGVLKKNSDQQFPKFETYRQQIDGKYWFPVYTYANELLTFDSGQRVRIKMTVKYADYRQFKSDVKITFGDPVEQPKQEEAKPQPKKP
ncbi:MAG: hypothetical protein U0Q16_08510 [Bryobacteraceae bacterium]